LLSERRREHHDDACGTPVSCSFGDASRPPVGAIIIEAIAGSPTAAGNFAYCGCGFLHKVAALNTKMAPVSGQSHSGINAMAGPTPVEDWQFAATWVAGIRR
jgi:hypothetical protein